MKTMELTSDEAFMLLGAISAAIAIHNRCLETLNSLHDMGIDSTEDIAREEVEIERLNALARKIPL